MTTNPDESLNYQVLLESVAPAVNGPKLAFGVSDAAAHEAWCAGRGMTSAQYADYLNWLLAPDDPFDRLAMDSGDRS